MADEIKKVQAPAGLREDGSGEIVAVVDALTDEYRETLKALADQGSEPMKIEIKKIGNSTGFILPKELVQRLRLELGDDFFVTETADGGIKLNRADPAFEKGMKIARKAMKTYRNALGELAK